MTLSTTVIAAVAKCFLPRQVWGTLATSAGLLVGGIAQAQITFEFDYTNNAANVGFLNPVTGAARQSALVQAGNLYSNLFSSHFTHTATIKIDVSSTDDINTPTLASAGSYLVGPAPGFGQGEVIRNKLQTGIDLTGAGSDGVVDVNWGYTWELNPNTPAVGPGPGQSFDFYAALFHEFTHALGFSNAINFAGSDAPMATTAPRAAGASTTSSCLMCQATASSTAPRF